MDIIVWLYHEELNTISAGPENPDRDIYFSSKGHDVPGLYSLLHSFGVITEERLLKLRRLGGLDGHPDLGIPGIEANSGSLGMGISKGKGMAWAKRRHGYQGGVFVMTGDGELQEGQNYEALETAAHQLIGNLIVIVDHNKVQSDKQVSDIVDLGDLEHKFEVFGWQVARCDGHDFRQIEYAMGSLKAVKDRPKVLIADTIKGRGVSFMEHPEALKDSGGLYPWHSGAPDDQSFIAAHQELIRRTNARLIELGQEPLRLKQVEPEEDFRVASVATNSLLGEPVSEAAQSKIASSVSDEYVGKAFGDALVDIGSRRPDLVVLDADLAADCRVRGFEETYPERFIENGISEQDMVSMAGGIALQGLLPVVNSFASFLASRANEQIYNNASEKTKILYACHYAGLIPAGPGKSHQSLRDISLLGALPNCIVLQPCNALETRMVVEYCVEQAEESCAIRLAIGPSPRLIQLPGDYEFTWGKGVGLAEGVDAVMFSYGPVMLHEALLASEVLSERSFGLTVINMPWLNRVDSEWLAQTVSPFTSIYVLEDHSPVGGLGDLLLNRLCDLELLGARRLRKFAVDGYPACGRPQEALRFHGLDGLSLADRILRDEDSSN
jgi:transketolase